MVSCLPIFFSAAAVLHIGAADCKVAMGCTANEHGDTPKGSAMLQVVRQQSAPSAHNVECNANHAKEQPLTEEGFAEVSSSCCFTDVKEYIRRLVDDLGHKVCDEGGLSGISPFYACPASPVTLAMLKEELMDAVQTKRSKCHWLVERYAECVPVSVECQVAFSFPHPAPEPVTEGFIAFRATNPAEMVRSSKIIDIVTEKLGLATGVETKYVNVVMATGAIDGQESQSLLMVPRSQAIGRAGITLHEIAIRLHETATCKVFALYSFQDKIGAPQMLSESGIVDAMNHLDTRLLASRITQELQKVDPGVGVVEVAETSVCDKTSGKCNHKVLSTPASE